MLADEKKRRTFALRYTYDPMAGSLLRYVGFAGYN